MARGLGVDLVHLPAFAEQVDQPGSRFLQGVLTPREARRVRARAAATCPADPSSALARHAGGLWAAKEAFVKAWSAALYASPPPVDPLDVDWREIEVVFDAWNRPALRLHGRIGREYVASFDGPRPGLLVSISHDGDYAIAEVLIG